MRPPGEVARTYPNATTAAGGGGAGVLLVWVLGLLGVPVGPEEAGALAGVCCTVLVAIGHRGVRGCLLYLWRGRAPVPEQPAGIQ